MIIYTDYVMPDPTNANSHVAIGHGFEALTGDEVTFIGDVRIMAAVLQALHDGERPNCNVEPWMILSRQPVPDGAAAT